MGQILLLLLLLLFVAVPSGLHRLHQNTGFFAQILTCYAQVLTFYILPKKLLGAGISKL